MATIKLSDITTDGPIRSRLTDDQKRRLQVIHKVFSEVFTISLEETIMNFRREANPEIELLLWESMAKAYKKALPLCPTPEERKAFFVKLLKNGPPVTVVAIKPDAD